MPSKTSSILHIESYIIKKRFLQLFLSFIQRDTKITYNTKKIETEYVEDFSVPFSISLQVMYK